MNFLRNRWVWLTALFWLLTPLIFYLACLERGYRAIGGEIFFPLIPLLIWMVVKTIKSDKAKNEAVSCFGVYRSPQSDAENCCCDCENETECFNDLRKDEKQ